MNILLQLENEEDINYLQPFSEEKKDLIVKTAVTIGLKSIQMSEVITKSQFNLYLVGFDMVIQFLA